MRRRGTSSKTKSSRWRGAIASTRGRVRSPEQDGFLSGVRAADQLGEDAVLGNEIIEGSLLGDAALIENENAIGLV